MAFSFARDRDGLLSRRYTPTMARTSFLPFLLFCSFALRAQPTLLQKGEPFERSLKGSTGDLITVVDGIFAKDGRHVLFVEEGLTPKIMRLDAKLLPAEELVLKDVMDDAQKWTAVRPILQDGNMRCLMVTSTKKGSSFGLADVRTEGGLSLGPVRRIASFELPHTNDPSHTMVVRPLPDPILFTRGMAFAQHERLISSPDGKTHLLSLHSHGGKGNKRFAFACLDDGFKVLWQGAVELPYADASSTIHQIHLGPDGTIHLLTYLFPCKPDQMGDKNCHEMHLTTIADQGKAVKDQLVEKGFVSSARMLGRDKGRLAIALRYGALTGIPGVVLSFDHTDPKLKPTAIASQRLPSIRKTRLPAFGDPTADPRKPLPRTAKVPDEVVALLPANDGGMIVVETFLDHAFQLPMGEAIAIRQLSGNIRVSHIQTNDSIGRQHELPRSLMTTAGLTYQGSNVQVNGEGVLIFHNHTPRGYEAILQAGNQAGADKSLAPAEPQVLRAASIGSTGELLQQGTALIGENDFVPCPSGILLEPGGERALVKLYDRGTGYRFALLDLGKLGKE